MELATRTQKTWDLCSLIMWEWFPANTRATEKGVDQLSSSERWWAGGQDTDWAKPGPGSGTVLFFAVWVADLDLQLMAEEGTQPCFPASYLPWIICSGSWSLNTKCCRKGPLWIQWSLNRGKSRMFSGCPSQPRSFQNPPNPFKVWGKEERAGLRLRVTVHQLFFITF